MRRGASIGMSAMLLAFGTSPAAATADTGGPDTSPECTSDADCSGEAWCHPEHGTCEIGPKPECGASETCPPDDESCIEDQCVRLCSQPDACDGDDTICWVSVCVGRGDACDDDGDCYGPARCDDGVCRVDPGAVSIEPACEAACTESLDCPFANGIDEGATTAEEACISICSYATAVGLEHVSHVEGCANAPGDCNATEEVCVGLGHDLAALPVAPALLEPGSGGQDDAGASEAEATDAASAPDTSTSTDTAASSDVPDGSGSSADPDSTDESAASDGGMDASDAESASCRGGPGGRIPAALLLSLLGVATYHRRRPAGRR